MGLSGGGSSKGQGQIKVGLAEKGHGAGGCGLSRGARWAGLCPGGVAFISGVWLGPVGVDLENGWGQVTVALFRGCGLYKGVGLGGRGLIQWAWLATNGHGLNQGVEPGGHGLGLGVWPEALGPQE